MKEDVMDRLYAIIQMYKRVNCEYLKKDICRKHLYMVNNIFHYLNDNYTLKYALSVFTFFKQNSTKLTNINLDNNAVIDLINIYIQQLSYLKANNKAELTYADESRFIKVSYV
jgi:hypothetical protein